MHIIFICACLQKLYLKPVAYFHTGLSCYLIHFFIYYHSSRFCRKHKTIHTLGYIAEFTHTLPHLQLPLA